MGNKTPGRSFQKSRLAIFVNSNIFHHQTDHADDIDELNAKTNYDLTNKQLENVWKCLVQLSGDELIGLHFGVTMQIGALNTVGQIIQTSHTVKEALQHACSLVHLNTCKQKS